MRVPTAFVYPCAPPALSAVVVTKDVICEIRLFEDISDHDSFGASMDRMSHKVDACRIDLNISPRSTGAPTHISIGLRVLEEHLTKIHSTL